MEPLGSAVREKVQLEKSWKNFQTLHLFGSIWLIVLVALLLFDRYSSFHPLRELSIAWVRVLDLLLIAVFVTLIFVMFPSKSERETWARLTVLEFLISRDTKGLAERLDSLRSVGFSRLFDNPTFRYWVPLYHEFQRLGIDVTPPVEERFARLDRNRLNFFWAPVRRERELKALKSVE